MSKLEHEFQTPQPNKADIMAQLTALFPPDFVHPYPDALIEIAYGMPGNIDKAELFSAFKLEAAADFAIAKNRRGCNVYIGPTLKKGGTAPFARTEDTDFLAGLWSWTDLDAEGDFETAGKRAIEANLAPGMIVTTGTVPHLRAHVYCKIAGGVTDGEELRRINQSVIKCLGGDAVQNPGRVLRLAGTVNHPTREKAGRGYVIETVTVRTQRTPHEHAKEALAGLCTSPGASANDNSRRKDPFGFDLPRDDAELLALLEASRTPGKWHNSMLRAIASMFGRGWPDLAIRLACAPYCRGGKDDPDLGPMIEGAHAKWDKSNAEGDGLNDEFSSAGGQGNAQGGAAPLKYEVLHEMPEPLTLLPAIIKGIFFKRETSMWYGPPGGLKSALMADATVAIANGEDWFGRKSKGKFGVVYFALERADLVRRRLQATIANRGITEPLAVAVVPGIRGLSTASDAAQILATIAEISEAFQKMDVDGVGVIVIDTWAKLVAAGGADESSAKDVGPIFANLQRIKDLTGVHVALVGHTGKDKTKGVRGSSAIPGDFDLGVAIDGDAIKTATVEKANAVPEGKLFSFGSQLHSFGVDDDGDPIDVNVIKPAGGGIGEAGPRKRVWPPALTVFRNALNEVAINSSVAYQIPQGPAVRAVKVADVRKQYTVAYPHDGTGDRKKAADQRWRRHFKQAVDSELVGYRTDGAEDWMWNATGA